MAERKRGYEIILSNEATAQVRTLFRRDRDAANRITDAIADRLTFEPTRQDRNRKPRETATPLPTE